MILYFIVPCPLHNIHSQLLPIQIVLLFMKEYEPCSDGEIRLSMRPSMIARVAGHDKHRKKQRSTFPKEPPGDDPVGVYARPRHPLPDIEDEEDISVGEVRPKTSNVARRNKFRQWREQR